MATMITPTSCCPELPPHWHVAFVTMLPTIEQKARFAFRDLKGDNHDDAVQEVTCNACQAYARLVEQGRAEVTTASVLANYAIRHYHAGRRVGNSLNVRDVCSRHCQAHKPVSVRSIHRWDAQDEEWSELVLEDRHTTPADLAAFRIDFREWLRTLARRERRIMFRLVRGETTGRVARMFRLSPARVSQLRRQLRDGWTRFVADRPKGQAGLSAA